jgi:hypothetical protein
MSKPPCPVREGATSLSTQLRRIALRRRFAGGPLETRTPDPLIKSLLNRQFSVFFNTVPERVTKLQSPLKPLSLNGFLTYEHVS